ncbi:MAG: hypothetical protein JXA67_00910 [Micromonosporaceae bacterium]|nr:hypothetical protein [Micromonosporaceae bacterium]
MVLQQALADLKYRVPQLLRLGHRQASGPEGGAAPVPVSQGSPAGNSVHQELAVPMLRAYGRRQRATFRTQEYSLAYLERLARLT